MYHTVNKSPPQELSPENHKFLTYIIQEMINITNGAHDFDPDGIVPDKIAPGMIRYFDADGAATIGGSTDGFYYVDVSNAWRAIPDRAWAAKYFVVASFGGLIDNSAPTPMPDIDATWQTITAFDAESVPSRGVVVNIPNSSIAPAYEGVWQVSVLFSILHNEQNSGRNTGIRLFNLTDAVPGTSMNVPIARNQPGTLITSSLLVNVIPNSVDNEFVIQVGGGDTLTSVVVQSATYSLQHLDAAPLSSIGA